MRERERRREREREKRKEKNTKREREREEKENDGVRQNHPRVRRLRKEMEDKRGPLFIDLGPKRYFRTRPLQSIMINPFEDGAHVKSEMPLSYFFGDVLRKTERAERK